MSLGMLGKYEKIDVLGNGTAGIVYRARDTRLNKKVAIKVSHKLPVSEHDYRLEEARIMDRLHHVHIATFHTADVIENQVVIEMEYVNGQNLYELLHEQGKLPINRACEIAAHLLEALAHAHERDIIHRDLKPQNVLIAKDGTVKLADFSNARVLVEGMYYAGGGTFPYMAPESFEEGQLSDARADVWSIGVLLYEMITGVHPYKAQNPRTLQEWRQAVKMPFTALDAQLSDSVFTLHGVISRALACDKHFRFQTAREFLETLKRTGLYQPSLSAEDHFCIEQFETAYNRIDDWLRRNLTAEAKTPFVQLAHEYARQNSQWRDLSELLRLNGIRRDLAHRHKQANEYRPIPSQQDIASIEAIEQRLLAISTGDAIEPAQDANTTKTSQPTEPASVVNPPAPKPNVPAIPDVIEEPDNQIVVPDYIVTHGSAMPAITADGLRIIVIEFDKSRHTYLAEYDLRNGTRTGSIFCHDITPKAITTAHGGGFVGTYKNGDFAMCGKWTHWQPQVLSQISFSERLAASWHGIEQKATFINGGNHILTMRQSHFEVWDVLTCERLNTWKLDQKIRSVYHNNIFVVAPNGVQVLLSEDRSYDGQAVSVWDLHTGYRGLRIVENVDYPFFSYNGQYLVYATKDGNYRHWIKVWDVFQKEEVCRIAAKSDSGVMAFSPDNHHLLLEEKSTYKQTHELCLFDVKTGQIARKIIPPQDESTLWFSFLPNGEEIVMLTHIKYAEDATRICLWKL